MREAAAAQAAAEEKRRLEIEELRRQGKWKTHDDVEREQREAEEAYRRSQQGLIGKLKGLVAAKGGDRVNRRDEAMRPSEEQRASAEVILHISAHSGTGDADEQANACVFG